MTRFKQRPSPALIVSCVALFVALSGSAYAVSKVQTQDIARQAVTSSKIDGKAVKGGKIAGGSVKGGKIQAGAVKAGKIDAGAVSTEEIAGTTRGVALAGATVDPTGVVTQWFNRFGGAPTVANTAAGRYTVTVPGLAGSFTGKLIASATLASGPGGEIAAAVDAGGNPGVFTWNSAGTLTNRTFQIVIYEGSNVG
ncbi:MAG: hypothetical protein GEU88_11985 [Solirubrobacterales bacterium]|nr:hypothetical protein [Solirubrobacterales bacterium]